MTADRAASPGPDGAQPKEEAELQERLGAAARGSSFGRVAESATTGRALLAAMGGAMGIVEALVPGILFIVLYVVATRAESAGAALPLGMDALWLSVAVPALAGVVFLVIRLLRRQPAAAAIGGLLGLLLSGFLALRSGEGTDYFVLGFWTNALYGSALLVSMLVGWPLIGIVAGALFGSWRDWRRQRGVFVWMQVITGVWVAFFGARLAVQLPLYFAGAVEALGVARLLMGPPLFGVLVVITVLFVRAVHAPAGNARSEDAAPTDRPDASRA